MKMERNATVALDMLGQASEVLRGHPVAPDRGVLPQTLRNLSSIDLDLWQVARPAVVALHAVLDRHLTARVLRRELGKKIIRSEVVGDNCILHQLCERWGRLPMSNVWLKSEVEVCVLLVVVGCRGK